jgi:hypothetical protein
MTMSECAPTREETSMAPCRNEGCGRPAEAGEAYCVECGLERSLFRRERRIEAAQRTERPSRAAGQRPGR